MSLILELLMLKTDLKISLKGLHGMAAAAEETGQKAKKVVRAKVVGWLGRWFQ